jgi:hypothetical protein
VNAIERRLPHVLPRKDLAQVLVPTYAAAMDVDDDEAAERLGRALASAAVLAELHRAVAGALHETQGPRTTDDALVDKLSAGVLARRARVKAAPGTPGLAAVLVRVNLEIGHAPEPMRATLATERGRAVLEQGLAELGRHLVKELLR